MCPGLLPPANGAIAFADDTTIPHDVATVATYSCNIGYMLIGGDSMRTCTTVPESIEGEWSGTEPSCTRKCEEYFCWNCRY